ncbi:MAG: hypothetical protein SPE99_10910 [Blautia sp.]|nr:hypothetical protein [Blautia sp.]
MKNRKLNRKSMIWGTVENKVTGKTTVDGYAMERFKNKKRETNRKSTGQGTVEN